MILKVLNQSKYILPEYKSKGAAAFDLQADLDEPLILKAGCVDIIPTGLFFEIPENFEIQIRSRSGLATKGIFVVNSPGTIDSDYRGEVKIILGNISKEDFTIEPGDRVAQAVVAVAGQVNLFEVKTLSKTERGDGGFGSTGKN